MNDLQPVSVAVKPNFPLGRTLITANALETLATEDVHSALARHARCDWGDLCPEDSDANDDAVWSGGRLLSSYHDRTGENFWIITEADRSATTVLLPDDY